MANVVPTLFARARAFGGAISNPWAICATVLAFAEGDGDSRRNGRAPLHNVGTYGSHGAAIGFMTWMWISVIVVLLGAEFDQAIARTRHRGKQ